MNRIAKAVVVITVGAAIAVGIPGVRQRCALLVRRAVGFSAKPWSEIAVQMAPHRWQKRARKILRPGEEWNRHLNFPLQLGSEKVRMYSMSRDPTPNLDSLDCHYTVLAEGQTPHPPHVHDDEEIIIPLVNSVDILRASAADLTTTREKSISFGKFVYHASRLPHTIRAVGPGPSAYLVLRWSASADEGTPDGAIPAQTFDFGKAFNSEPLATEALVRTLIFEGPTRLLRRLHVHASLARPGEGSDRCRHRARWNCGNNERRRGSSRGYLSPRGTNSFSSQPRTPACSLSRHRIPPEELAVDQEDINSSRSGIVGSGACLGGGPRRRHLRTFGRIR